MALDWRLDSSGAFGWALAAFAFRRLAKELNEHGVIDLAAERGVDRVEISPMTVCRDLHSICET